MSFDVLKKIEELKKSDMICAEGRYELVKAEVLKDMNSAGLILRHKKSCPRNHGDCLFLGNVGYLERAVGQRG